MTCECIKCKNCNSILVVDQKEVWHLTKCPTCGSADLISMDEEFENVEIIGDENE